MNVRKAVIPVAGVGTRFLPATKSIPKEMLPIVDRPTIHYIVEEVCRSGIEQVIFVTGAGKSAIEDYFDRSYGLEAWLAEKGKDESLAQMKKISEMIEVQTVRQKTALGLGHAVLCAKDFIGDEPFAVLLGDDLFDGAVAATRQLTAVHEKTGDAVLGVFRVPDDQTHQYGMIDPEPANGRLSKVRGLVEKPAGKAPSNLAIVGRYILPPKIFDCIQRTPKGKGGEIQLTDAMAIMLAEGGGISAWELEGDRHDAGDIFGYLEANIAYAMKRPEMAGRLRELFRRCLSKP
jgi:UTP--glucose-1-phosphate uridylyltransferase